MNEFKKYITTWNFQRDNMQLELICAKKTDIKILNAFMRQSKAHWGYDLEFMDKFMDLFQITRPYFERSITKLLYMKPPKEPTCHIVPSFSRFKYSLFQNAPTCPQNRFILGMDVKSTE